MSVSKVNVEALKSDIRQVLINQKANACPIALRLAWHASGTYSEKEQNGGLNGATMRFAPEANDPANAGLNIPREMLELVKIKHPEVSYADLWAIAGCAALEFLGGPKIDVKLGRTDATSPKMCPVLGRLPDGAKGADHIRDVFYRMGFNDQEIVALCGAHTLGSCHRTRSGFEGPWTRNALKFDNGFYKNLLFLEWIPRKWDGNFQYTDADTEELMMLPSDIALRDDPEFRKWSEIYAKDEKKFFEDFANAFAKLISLGLPSQMHAAPSSAGSASAKVPVTPSWDFREQCMHGNIILARAAVKNGADVHSLEETSARTALHKAAFWGHVEISEWLLGELGLNPNAPDYSGDSPLHDAVRFGHTEVVKILLRHKADVDHKNKELQSPIDLARYLSKQHLVELMLPYSKKPAGQKL